MSIFINGFEVDVALEEEHVFETQTTPYPVEDGADQTDHIRVMPNKVTLVGLVSDTPVSVQRPQGSIPSQDAFNVMVDIRNERKLVTITTSLKDYTNMALTSLRIPRNASSGDSLEFRATFEELIIVTTERTIVTVTLPRAKKKVNRGNKASKPSPDVAPSPSSTSRRGASILHGLIN